MDDYDLGMNYLYGYKNYKQDKQKAIQHLSLAAEKKDVRAMYLLGHAYIGDKEYNLARDQLLFFICLPNEIIRIYQPQQIGDVCAKLGFLYDKDNRKQEAIDFYIKAQGLNIVLDDEINSRINEYFALIKQRIETARKLVENEKYSEAKKLLIEPIEQYPYHDMLRVEFYYYSSCVSNKLYSYPKYIIEDILEYEHPDELVCPISRQIFRDPVICNDGHTYERNELGKWFEKNKNMPKIFSPMDLETEIFFDSIISNKNLIHAVIRYIEERAKEITSRHINSPKLALIV